jgi:methionyl-tRNA synthetase
MYVWFDALTNHMTAVGFGSDQARFEKSGRLMCI